MIFVYTPPSSSGPLTVTRLECPAQPISPSPSRVTTTTNEMDLTPTTSSRRSPVYGRRCAASSSQPLATSAGLRVLRDMGGTAADAAVAMLAATAVLEPWSTGPGGDCFALRYDASRRGVEGLNGSGRSPAALTLEAFNNAPARVRERALAVTVPGAVRAWDDMRARWGRLPLEALLQPAVELAEMGFPVAPVTAHYWNECVPQLQGAVTPLNPGTGRRLRPGDVVKNPHVASVLRRIGKEGPDAFYRGDVAARIAKAVQDEGGLLTVEDLAAHEASEFVEPIKTSYRGKVEVYECPPNGQGLAALMALQAYEKTAPTPTHVRRDSPEHIFALVQSMRASFADARAHICDPAFAPSASSQTKVRHAKELLHAEDAIDARLKRIREAYAAVPQPQPRGASAPLAGSDTISLQVVDASGDSMSVVNSNYQGFGTGIVPSECGFTLQNRGANFSTDPTHPNVLAPRKRPYHTILPGMSLYPDGRLHASFTVMGGFMQPQGHLQVMSNLVDWSDDPQSALDHARFCIDRDETVALEETFPNVEELARELGKMGLQCKVVRGWDRSLFGRGQIITKSRVEDDGYGDVLCAGSDGRCDGAAMAW